MRQRIHEELTRAAAEEEAKNRPIRDRQWLVSAHTYYRVNESLGIMYSPKHLYILKCPNDKRRDAFLNEWFITLARIPNGVPADLLRDQLLEQMRDCACMEHATRNYDSATVGENNRTYEYLLAMAQRQINLETEGERRCYLG